MVIDIKNVSYRYGSTLALKNLNFSIQKGELLGIVGPNGGGKTTLFSLLITARMLQEGEIWIEGKELSKNIPSFRKKMGVVFQSQALDKHLTSFENLVHAGHLYGLKGQPLREKARHLLQQFGLSEKYYSLSATLSGGEKRKLELARALISEPSFLFMDEPTVGLDPFARKDFWSIIHSLKSKMTILTTTHLIEEAELCDRIALIHQGKLLSMDSPQSIKEKIGIDVMKIKVSSSVGLKKKLLELFPNEIKLLEEKVSVEDWLFEMTSSVKPLDTKNANHQSYY